MPAFESRCPWLLPVVAAVAVMVSGCLDNVEGPGQTVAKGRPIVGGSPDTNPAHMAVVALTQGPGTGYFCSGTLVSPNVVVTAACRF